jgi:hypothetical protein
VTVQDYRAFFIETRRKLRLSDFSTAMVFFDARTESSDDFVKRLKKYKVDTVLWYLPDAAADDIGLRLKDVGIRLVGVGDGNLSTITCRYEIRRETAITAILRDWKLNSTVNFVTVIRGARSTAYEERLEAILEKQNLRYEVLNLGTKRVDSFLDSIGNGSNKAVVFLSSAASMFALRAPEDFAQLLNRCRVGFIGGPVSMPFGKPLDARVDLVIVDWQAVADRIVSEFMTKRAFSTKSTLFEARYELRVPLSQYAMQL